MLLCYGDIKRNPGPFTNKKIRSQKKLYYQQKKDLLKEKSKVYYKINIHKKNCESRNLSAVEYGRNPKRKKLNQ